MKVTVVAALLLLCLPGFAVGAPGPLLVRWVTVNGMRIRCLDTAPCGAAGPVLLMVHGWAGSAEDFWPLFDLLPPGCRAIAVDLPGCGGSDKPDVAYDLPFFVDFLRSFCDSLGLDSFVLVGHSMGGQFAVHFAARWPDAVQSLILIAPYGLSGEEGPLRGLARWGGLVELGLQLNNRLFIEWTLRANVLYRPTEEMVRAAVESASGILGPEGSRAMARITRNVIGHDYVDELLPLIPPETLVIWGDHDRVLPPQWGETFLALMPRARLEVVEDSGHIPMIEKPVETARLISGFIGG